VSLVCLQPCFAMSAYLEICLEVDDMLDVFGLVFLFPCQQLLVQLLVMGVFVEHRLPYPAALSFEYWVVQRVCYNLLLLSVWQPMNIDCLAYLFHLLVEDVFLHNQNSV
jgi:hypothetical protein